MPILFAILLALAWCGLRAGVRAALRTRGDHWIRRIRMAPRSSAA